MARMGSSICSFNWWDGRRFCIDAKTVGTLYYTEGNYQNDYAYVRGNPLSWTDPLGLVCPGALTPDEIVNANDQWANVHDAQDKVTAAQTTLNVDPGNNALARALSEAQANAARALARWYSDVGTPADPRPSPDNGQAPRQISASNKMTTMPSRNAGD